MTPAEVLLVHQSVVRLLADRPAMAALFYDRGFAMVPDNRVPFSSGLAVRATTPLAALELVGAALDRVEVLVWSLERVPGDGWTAAQRDT